MQLELKVGRVHFTKKLFHPLKKKPKPTQSSRIFHILLVEDRKLSMEIKDWIYDLFKELNRK